MAANPPRRGTARRSGVHISAGYLYLPEDVANGLFGKPPRSGEIPRVHVQFVPKMVSVVRVVEPADALWEYGLRPTFEAGGGVRIRVAQRLHAAGLPRGLRQEYVRYVAYPDKRSLSLFLSAKEGLNNGMV